MVYARGIIISLQFLYAIIMCVIGIRLALSDVIYLQVESPLVVHSYYMRQ